MYNKEKTIIVRYPAGKIETIFFIPDCVTSIGNNAFETCQNLNSVTIHNLMTNIGNNAFSKCNLTSVVIGNAVTNIGEYAFSHCYNLTSVTISNSVINIGSGAFYSCYNLTSMIIPDAVTSIGDRAFSNCSGLTSIIIPNSVISIGNEAFSTCRNLTSVIIGSSATNIGSWAFSNCSSLISVTIAGFVTNIGEYAFCFCNNNLSITLLNPIPVNINSNVFLYVDIANCTLTVPASSVDAYKAAAVWKDFNIVGSTGIDNPLFADIKVHSSSAGIEVFNTPIGTSIEVYTINGTFVTRTTETFITLSQTGIYIVKVGDFVTKVVK